MTYITVDTSTTQFDERWDKAWETNHPNETIKPAGDIWRFVKDRVSYRPDTGDEWQSPSRTLDRRAGDCEDWALLFMWLAHEIDEVPTDKIRMVVCLKNGEHHAFADVDGVAYDCQFRIEPINTSRALIHVKPLWSLWMNGRKQIHIPAKLKPEKE